MQPYKQKISLRCRNVYANKDLDLLCLFARETRSRKGGRGYLYAKVPSVECSLLSYSHMRAGGEGGGERALLLPLPSSPLYGNVEAGGNVRSPSSSFSGAWKRNSTPPYFSPLADTPRESFYLEQC